MKVIITGATGMVGKGVLLECLDHPKVQSVLTIGRSLIDIDHDILVQIEHKDFSSYENISDQLKNHDACYMCMGISAAGLSEEKYSEITYDYTMALAQKLYELNPD
ncbi:MAG: epimerase, partial [Saprospiraceae bacterium]|nr:epimerase [Saprospiraceae bacterium]